MKFLLVLSLMASMSAFAQRGGHDNEETIKCWDTAQGRRGYPTYVFELDRDHHMDGRNELELKFPRKVDDFERRRNDCLVARDENHHGGGPVSTEEPRNPRHDKDEFEICLGEGQRINGLIPIEVDERFFEGTVYCEREIKEAFEHHGGGTGGWIQ